MEERNRRVNDRRIIALELSTERLCSTFLDSVIPLIISLGPLHSPPVASCFRTTITPHGYVYFR